MPDQGPAPEEHESILTILPMNFVHRRFCIITLFASRLPVAVQLGPSQRPRGGSLRFSCFSGQPIVLADELASPCWASACQTLW